MTKPLHPSKYPHCVYCGGPRECVDHVLPFAHRHHPEANQNCRFLVSCCNACNAAAGDKLFSDFYEKAHFLLNVAEAEGRGNANNFEATKDPMRTFTYLVEEIGIREVEELYHGNDPQNPIARYSYGRTKTDKKRRDKGAIKEAREALEKAKRIDLHRRTGFWRP